MKKGSCEHISESKEISFSNKQGTVPLDQPEVVNKIDVILNKDQLSTFSNQHSSGVELPKCYKNESKFC